MTIKPGIAPSHRATPIIDDSTAALPKEMPAATTPKTIPITAANRARACARKNNDSDE